MKHNSTAYDAASRFFLRIVSPFSQIVFIFISGFLVMALAYGPVKRFFSLEPSPQLLPITPQKVKAWGGESTTVVVGLHIRNFPEFDLITNEFIIDGVLNRLDR